MDIHLKFELNQEIWYVNNHAEIEHSKVTEINIRVFCGQPIVKYRTAKCMHDVLEEVAFASQEELINRLQQSPPK